MSRPLPAGDPVQHDLDYHGDAELGAADLNLAVNVRLPQPPSWLLARLQTAMAGLASYPRQDAAIAAVAARHGRGASHVLLTNGAAEAFTLLSHAFSPRHAVCVHPSFTEPEAALRAAGHDVGGSCCPAVHPGSRAGTGRRRLGGGGQPDEPDRRAASGAGHRAAGPAGPGPSR
jgi:hypothetical protein